MFRRSLSLARRLGASSVVLRRKRNKFSSKTRFHRKSALFAPAFVHNPSELWPQNGRRGSARTFMIFPVPFLIGAKLASLFVAKKVAFLALLRVYGVKRTFKALHKINAQLLKGKEEYDQTAFKAVDSGLKNLEKTIAVLHETDQVREMWAWFENIGKTNPTFASAFTKTFLQSTTPYKWMRTVMTDAKDSDGKSQSEDADSTDTASWTGMSEEEHAALCDELLAGARPEIRDRYHLFLVPKKIEELDEAVKYEADHMSDLEDLRAENAKLKDEIESLRSASKT